jgi:hypothetical protein
LAQSVSQFFVNFSPVIDREDPDDSRFAIQFELFDTDLNPQTMAPTACSGDLNLGWAYGDTPLPEFAITSITRK